MPHAQSDAHVHFLKLDDDIVSYQGLYKCRQCHKFTLFTTCMCRSILQRLCKQASFTQCPFLRPRLRTRDNSMHCVFGRGAHFGLTAMSVDWCTLSVPYCFGELHCYKVTVGVCAALLRLKPATEGKQAVMEPVLTQKLPGSEREAVKKLQKEAIKCWWQDNHPGWSIWPIDSNQFLHEMSNVVRPFSPSLSSSHRRV